MGKTATVFKDIGKACSDLLTKDFKVDKSTVEVKSKTSNGMTLTPSATKAGDKFSGSLKGECKVSGIAAETTLATSGKVESKFEMPDVLTKGTLLELALETPASGKKGLLSKAQCTLDYKQEAFTCKSSYDYYSGALAAAMSCAFQGFTLGCSADFNTEGSKAGLQKYATACQFVQPDFTLVAKLEQDCAKGPKYTGTYYHKVSSDMQVGTQLLKGPKSDVQLSFGCMYKLDKDTSVKAKVDSEGLLSTSYKQKISAITTMTLAAEVDTVKLADNNHKFGMVLNLTV